MPFGTRTVFLDRGWEGKGGQNYPRPLFFLDGSTEYLGVKFVRGPQPVLGEAAVFELFLMYSEVDYSPLVPGVSVTVREGGRVVARGRVLERV